MESSVMKRRSFRPDLVQAVEYRLAPSSGGLFGAFTSLFSSLFPSHPRTDVASTPTTSPHKAAAKHPATNHAHPATTPKAHPAHQAAAHPARHK
jgi:hypothetical protein